MLVKQGRQTEALLYAERAKARVLLDVINSGRADFTKKLTPPEKEQHLRLNQRISDLNESLRGQRSSNADALYSQLDAVRLEYQAFQNDVYVNHPELRLRSGRTASLTTTEIADLVVSNTAYLEYVVTKDAVSLFVLTTSAPNKVADVKVYPLDIEPGELLAKVNQFHGLARDLYAILIGPAQSKLKDKDTICIIPDTVLWNLPFQALMSAGNHYLIENHALFYTPSLSVLREIHRKRPMRKTTSSSLIAFGNPVIGRDEQRNEEVCPLPEAEAEVNAVARSFSPTRRKVLIGRRATENSFRALASSYSTIHLATHGVIDNGQPLYSHLLLTKSEGSVENDGQLEAREIMNLDLDADLAVLSACETANGRISPGEGVMGTSWAFFIAGTRSLLVSQWKVNSASTSQLMTNFYRTLESTKERSKSDKARLLQQATLQLMKNGRYKHPFY